MIRIDIDGLLDKCICGSIAVFNITSNGTSIECIDNCGESIPPVPNFHEAVIEWNKYIRRLKKFRRT
jgi:hypothetical protein